MGERERSSSARKSFFSFRNGTIVVLKEEEEKVQETGTIDRSVDPIENGSSWPWDAFYGGSRIFRTIAKDRDDALSYKWTYLIFLQWEQQTMFKTWTKYRAEKIT